MKAMSFALMLTLATAVTAVAEGEKYVSKEGRFAIAFPKDSEARNRKNEKGRMSLNAVLVESQGTSYGVAYCDVPEAELDFPTKTGQEVKDYNAFSYSAGLR